jgi:hypothetical protein
MDISNQLKTLAKGINPDTGELLDHNSCGNKPEAIRLLFLLAEELENSGHDKTKKSKPKLTAEERQAKQAKNLEMGRPKNSHFSWTEEEKKKLIAAYSDNDNLELLADKFERSTLAIAVQLGNADLLTEEDIEFYRTEHVSEN